MSPRRGVRLITLALAALTSGCPAPPKVAPFTGHMPPFAPGARLAVVGDLQRTSALELWREQNDPERRAVVRAITQERPDLLAITGDLVFSGWSASAWADLDTLTAPLRAAGIPAFAALGNHEYWGGRSATAHFFARFPDLEGQRWYTRAWGPLRFVVLDSNRGDLWEREWREQMRWFAATLAAFDADPEVRGVLVIAHHPPYTNSTVTGDELHMQRDIVPAFAAARKTLALLSGHVHSYERYERRGKVFVVSGGGGGPRARLAVGDARRHTDDRFTGPPLRDFHFIVMTVTPDGIAAEVRGTPKGGTTFRPMDHFFLRFP